MDALIETFHIDWKLLVAQIINFGIVFAVLYFFAIKPLSKIMRERSEKIETGLKDAEESSKKLSESQEQCERSLREAKRETQEILSKAKKDAEAKKAEMLAIAQNDVADLIAKGKAQLESEKEKMITEAKAEIVGLVTEALKKTLNEGITSDIDKKIIEKSVQETA